MHTFSNISNKYSLQEQLDVNVLEGFRVRRVIRSKSRAQFSYGSSLERYKLIDRWQLLTEGLLRDYKD